MKKFRCVKCGYEMRKNLKFCPECGQKIEEIDKMDELYTDDKENKAENKLEKLQEDLKIAIKEERYEDAAKIRDEIKKMSK